MNDIMCNKEPHKVDYDAIQCPWWKTRVIKMVVADSVLSSIFYTFRVILLVTKCIRGFWFHILKLVS